MSATATPISIPQLTPGAREAAGPRVASPSASPPHASAAQERGGTVLFKVGFVSQMTDTDLHRLARTLDLTTHMHPKMRPDPTSPGVARLDHWSGLFLERGSEIGRWTLEARTWGHPAAESVHAWHLLAAWAAHQLDPTVRVRLHAPVRALKTPATPATRRTAARDRRRLRREGVR